MLFHFRFVSLHLNNQLVIYINGYMTKMLYIPFFADEPIIL